MKPWLMAMIGRQRVLVTETFAGNTTWIAPMTTNLLVSLSGKGLNGTPAYDGEDGLLERKVVKIYQSGVLQSTTTTYKKYPNYSADWPDDQCFNEADSSGYMKETCYFHTPYDEDRAATTGAAATGFSKTFPGGTGGPASVTTFANVAVEPGKPYVLAIPAGGTMTFSYSK